jgi:hypothetical protein
MLNKNNQNKNSCEFGEQIVSYLYEETNAAEKVKLETHLQNCSFCADELSDFGIVRSSIIEWKNGEFSNIKAPVIEIPIDLTKNVSSNGFRDWVAKFYSVFNFKPAFTAVLALIVAGIGLTLFALNFSKMDETARIVNDVNNSVSAGSPRVEKTLTPPKDVAENQNSEPVSKEKNSSASLENELKDSRIKIAQLKQLQGNKYKNKSTANRETTDSVNSEQIRSVKALNKTSKKPVTNLNPQVPIYSRVEEEDDKSLRLADLFDEIDSK